MGGRMRNEKGLPPRPANDGLRDKWNKTTVKKYDEGNEKDSGVEFQKNDIQWHGENTELVNKYALTKNKWLAYQQIKDTPRLCSSVVEGILITKAVDAAVELGAA